MKGDIKSLMLARPGRWIAVAESVTCGRLQARIGAVSGASAYFRGGITAYTLDEKVRHLGVDRAAAKAVDCVSREVAEQMARGACALFGADFAAATTGYAEPLADPPVPQPFAWWAVARRTGEGRLEARSGRVDCPGADRVGAQERMADAAMAALADWIASSP
jgi:nicotinamide-nucleotide amidase